MLRELFEIDGRRRSFHEDLSLAASGRAREHEERRRAFDLCQAQVTQRFVSAHDARRMQTRFAHPLGRNLRAESSAPAAHQGRSRVGACELEPTRDALRTVGVDEGVTEFDGRILPLLFVAQADFVALGISQDRSRGKARQTALAELRLRPYVDPCALRRAARELPKSRVGIEGVRKKGRHGGVSSAPPGGGSQDFYAPNGGTLGTMEGPMRSRRFRVVGGVGLALLALVCLGRCTAKNATEVRALAAARAFRQLVEIESALMIPVATSTSTTRCSPTSVGGCTTWCDSDGTERTRSCEFRTDTEYTCGTAGTYTLGARKWLFRSPLSGLTSGEAGLEGSLASHFEISGKVRSTGDLRGVDIVCHSDFKLKLSASLVSLIQLDCQQFSCEVAGETVSCDQLQRALKDLTCTAAASDGSDGGSGGVSNPAGGSCLDPDPGGRCQDFTGAGWVTSIVEANCSSPNVFAERLAVPQTGWAAVPSTGARRPKASCATTLPTPRPLPKPNAV